MPSISHIKHESDDEPPHSPISCDPTTGKVEASLSSTEPSHPMTRSTVIKSETDQTKSAHCWFPGCNFTALMHGSITAHFMSNHTTGDTLTCTLPSCPSRPTFMHGVEFDRHLADTHPNVEIHCNICRRNNVRKAFNTYIKFKAHKTAYHPEYVRYTCLHCKEVYTEFRMYKQCISKHRKKEKKDKKEELEA